jgi:hypothetical protein
VYQEQYFAPERAYDGSLKIFCGPKVLAWASQAGKESCKSNLVAIYNSGNERSIQGGMWYTVERSCEQASHRQALFGAAATCKYHELAAIAYWPAAAPASEAR